MTILNDVIEQYSEEDVLGLYYELKKQNLFAARRLRTAYIKHRLLNVYTSTNSYFLRKFYLEEKKDISELKNRYGSLSDIMEDELISGMNTFLGMELYKAEGRNPSPDVYNYLYEMELIIVSPEVQRRKLYKCLFQLYLGVKDENLFRAIFHEASNHTASLVGLLSKYDSSSDIYDLESAFHRRFEYISQRTNISKGVIWESLFREILPLIIYHWHKGNLADAGVYLYKALSIAPEGSYPQYLLNFLNQVVFIDNANTVAN